MRGFEATSLAALLLLLCGCDSSAPAVDAGTDAGLARDAGQVRDAGAMSDAGQPRDAGRDAGEDPPDGGQDAGERGDAGGGSSCPCFGATEIGAIEAHAAGGGTRGCMTGTVTGNVTSGALSSTEGPMVLQVAVQAIVGFAGTDYTCSDGCSDLNDDLIDDCAGAPLGSYESEIVTQEQHDACEALIADACR